MKLKEVLNNANFDFPFNNFYNSRPWYLFIQQDMKRYMQCWFGNREVFDDLLTNYRTLDADAITRIKDCIDLAFMSNTYKYDHLWKLYTADYNPIWNVDGTETTVREKVNTGTQEDKLSGKDTLAKLGSEQNSKSGYDDVTQSGNIKAENSGGVQEARTTFDSDTDYDTNKTTDTTATTTTYNSKKDQTNYNSSATLSFTNRNDETTYGKTNTRTDNLNEQETVTHTRGGNIGLSMTQDMEQKELDWSLKFKLLEMIVRDIVYSVCYI